MGIADADPLQYAVTIREICTTAKKAEVFLIDLGVLFKHFLFSVIISMKETFKNIFSWG